MTAERYSGSRAWRTALACCALAACAGTEHLTNDANSPQAYLEDQLIAQHKGTLNKRTLEGAMLYYAEFDASNPNSLRVPFDLLKMRCENRSGHWSADTGAQSSAASLAQGNTPNEIRDRLADADQRGLFGTFRCEASISESWTAEIQPTALTPTDASNSWRLQLLLKAQPAGQATAGGELPVWQPMAAAPRPPPTAAGEAAPIAVPAPPAPATIELPPGTPSLPQAQSSALDQQPLRPPPRGDKLLADPRPFGIDMGSDSPDVFASKLRLPLDKHACPAAKGHKAPAGVSEFCWAHPGGQALALHARFGDLGLGPIVAEFEVRYPATAFDWLARQFVNSWGASDASSEHDVAQSWSWLHTSVQLTHASGEVLVRVSHRPTLSRSQLPPGSPAREQLGPLRIATPWQLQLGYEPAQLAQAKLQAAGFGFQESDCVDGGPHARPVLIRTCSLRGGRMDGLRSAALRIVDMGDGRTRIAQLEYSFEARVLDETVAELRKQYGEPIPVAGGALEWWTGPIGAEIAPQGDTFTLRYFHGRLMQYYFNAAEQNQSSEKAIQHQGL
jgi:hypothetical protein